MVWYPVPDFSARARNPSSTWLSMKMEMRVFPFCGRTAPRLPFEKSYSALIEFAFLSRRYARGNQSILVAALGVDDYQQFTCASKTNRDKALLAFRVRVLDRNRERILKHAFGIGKRNTVLSQICRRFGGIVATAHAEMIYMLYAYCKCVKLALPPRLVQGLLHRGEQVLEYRARAEIDFGAHLHAGR
jgi:hypothetical protein